jgi:hypothetical protein
MHHLPARIGEREPVVEHPAEKAEEFLLALGR